MVPVVGAPHRRTVFRQKLTFSCLSRRTLDDVPRHRLTPVPTSALSVAIDLEPLVDQLVARLRPLLNGQPTPDAARVQKRAYRTPEAAELLSISDSELRLLISQGQIDSIRVGRVRLVPASAIDAFIERKLAESRERAG
jgi:excisionase family DNA binding protein